MDMPFEIQAHRGARAFFPENTIPAFLKAVEIGCGVIELDLVVSRDRRIVVSHDPWLPSSDIAEPRRYLYQMSYEQIATVDCGTPSPDFPGQVKIIAARPTLEEVFQEVERRLAGIGRPGGMIYNLEVKSWAGLEGLAFPHPADYASLVVRQIHDSGIASRVRLQSFDDRIVSAAHRLDGELCCGLLVDKAAVIDTFRERMGFVPDYVNPHYSLVDRSLVEKLHRSGAMVVTWTVNDHDEMIRMRRLGVDGLITDHPELALSMPELA
jgi:glycerophosphoryl diester phosphodiesterase